MRKVMGFMRPVHTRTHAQRPPQNPLLPAQLLNCDPSKTRYTVQNVTHIALIIQRGGGAVSNYTHHAVVNQSQSKHRITCLQDGYTKATGGGERVHDALRPPSKGERGGLHQPNRTPANRCHHHKPKFYSKAPNG